jgi:hypothetical protein
MHNLPAQCFVRIPVLGTAFRRWNDEVNFNAHIRPYSERLFDSFGFSRRSYELYLGFIKFMWSWATAFGRVCTGHAREFKRERLIDTEAYRWPRDACMCVSSCILSSLLIQSGLLCHAEYPFARGYPCQPRIHVWNQPTVSSRGHGNSHGMVECVKLSSN